MKNHNYDICKHSIFNNYETNAQLKKYYKISKETNSFKKVREFSCQCVHCGKPIVPSKCVPIFWGICDTTLYLVMSIAAPAAVFVPIAVGINSAITICGIVVSLLMITGYSPIRNYIASRMMKKYEWEFIEINYERREYMKKNYILADKILIPIFISILLIYLLLI